MAFLNGRDSSGARHWTGKSRSNAANGRWTGDVLEKRVIADCGACEGVVPKMWTLCLRRCGHEALILTMSIPAKRLSCQGGSVKSVRAITSERIEARCQLNGTDCIQFGSAINEIMWREEKGAVNKLLFNPRFPLMKWSCKIVGRCQGSGGVTPNIYRSVDTARGNAADCLLANPPGKVACHRTVIRLCRFGRCSFVDHQEIHQRRGRS